MKEHTVIHPFKPILFSDTQILILGSFPSIRSIENNFYYAHPQNQFWKILSAITGYPALSKDQRLWLLKEAKLGLWDMISSCSRDNSLDSSLEDEEVNDIPALLQMHPAIKAVAFTGRKAEKLFEMHFDSYDIERIYLPSPSAALAKMSVEQKIAVYREKLFQSSQNTHKGLHQ